MLRLMATRWLSVDISCFPLFRRASACQRRRRCIFSWPSSEKSPLSTDMPMVAAIPHPRYTLASKTLATPFFFLLCFCVCLNVNILVQQCQVLVTHIDACGVLDCPQLKAFARALVANNLGPMAVVPGASGGHSVVLELAVHMASVLHCGKQRILVPLQNLALSPVTMQVSAFAVHSLVHSPRNYALNMFFLMIII